MDKTDLRILRRKLRLERLPDFVRPNDRHLQIYDRDLAGTRLRVRRTRNPETKEETFVIQKRESEGPDELRISLLVVDAAEYDALAACAHVETRKNRYFTEIAGRSYAVDAYLGDRQGLVEIRATFDSHAEMEAFEWPEFR